MSYTPIKLSPIPPTFLGFCTFIGVRLTSAQRILCAVAYDGLDPCDLETKHDREIARLLFGDVETIDPLCRAVVVHLCGARGGKSYVLCALRILHLALTVDVSQLAPGEIATALILAPKLKLARQTFRFALGAVRHTAALVNRLSAVTKESFVLQREGSRIVVVECLPASKGGDAVRARYYVAAALDEFAFFRNENYQVNDAELFQAVTPRILPGGQTILASTAWARTGLMHKLWSENFGHPHTVLASRAPTVLLNPSKRDEVKVEIRRDPVNAAREFGCEFMDAKAGIFFSHDAIDAAVHAGRMLVLPLKPTAGVQVKIGADTGFRRDSSAIVAVYEYPDGMQDVAEILELRPKVGQPLLFENVVEEFAKFCKRHGCKWLVADGHYRDAIEPMLAKENLSYVPASTDKAALHMQTKVTLHGGKLRLPPLDVHAHERLVEQMKELIGRPTSGGGMTFASPRTAMGGHGDILSALVLAVAQKSGQVVVPVEAPVLTPEQVIKMQTKERIEKYEQRRMDALATAMEDEVRIDIERENPATGEIMRSQVWGGSIERRPWYEQ